MRKAFGYFDFGVILIEIALWGSVEKISRAPGPVSPEAFKKELIATAEGKLPHCLGTDYAEAALKCLNRELETRDIPIQRTFFIEIVGVLGRCARSS